MHGFKKRPLAATTLSQPRSTRLAVIRWIYLASVAALALWLVNLFVGDRIFLSSQGLVVGHPAAVAMEFSATVLDVYVKDGQSVQAGDVVATVSSQTVVETIARLSTDLAIRATRETELRTRDAAIDSILTLAEERQKSASQTRSTLDALYERRNLGILQRSTAIESEFRSVRDLQMLQSEKLIVASELQTLTQVLGNLRNAIANLRGTYHDGRLRSPIDGVVVRVAVGKGSVIRAGEPLVELYGKQRFILAYVRTDALYEVTPGQAVVVKAGTRTQRGTVVRVEPFAAVLPQEFQRAFMPVDRRQVIQIELDTGETPPPLFAKVDVRSPLAIPSWIRGFWE